MSSATPLNTLMAKDLATDQESPDHHNLVTVRGALADGRTVSVSGTLWTNIMKRSDRLPAKQMTDEVSGFLRQRYGVVCLGPLGFENTYALAMQRERASELGIATIADLTRQVAGFRQIR